MKYKSLFVFVLLLITLSCWAQTKRYVPLGANKPCYASIQEAIDASNPVGGDLIYLASGTYDESVLVNKAVSIIGAGESNTLISHAIDMAAPDGIDRMVLKNFSVVANTSPIVSDTRYAIRINASSGNVAPITLDHITACVPLPTLSANGAGLLITANNHLVDDVKLLNCNFSNSYTHGLLIKNTSGKAGKVSDMEISGCVFNENNKKGDLSEYGFGLCILIENATPGLTADGFNINNSSFNGNFCNGMYVESITNLTLNNVTAKLNGREGVNLNLKCAHSENLAFNQCNFITNSQRMAHNYPDLHIDGRDDGEIYSLNPASVYNVNVDNSTIDYLSMGNNIRAYPHVSHCSLGRVVNDITTAGLQINSENNYWRTTAHAEIKAKIKGLVDYDTWCNSDFSVCGYTKYSVFLNKEKSLYFVSFEDALAAANNGETIKVLSKEVYDRLIEGQGEMTSTFNNNSGGVVTIVNASDASTYMDGGINKHNKTKPDDSSNSSKF